MKRRIRFALAGLLALTIAGTATAYMNWAQFLTEADYKQIALFKEVVVTVKNNHVEEIDHKKLVQGAVNGMLASLDPHSTYLPPEPFTEMKVQMAGEFAGIGIEITSADGKLTVVAPIEDTPASRAGIKAGDHIVKIDAASTRAMTTGDAVKLMRGPKGTNVTLHIEREGEKGLLQFPLERAIIQTRSVKFRFLEPGYGYIRIAHFQERTGTEFSKALQSLRDQNGGNLKGLVLDLRNNPGGLVDQAVAVANRFIGERLRDGLIFYSQGRGSGRQETNASVGEKEPRYPLVVLINGGSASASEIVAGAIQDHKRGVVMGTQSFGKGSIQAVLPLAGGAGLKLTTARYYTPSGRSIQARGITPDVEVPSLAAPAARKKKESGKQLALHGDHGVTMSANPAKSGDDGAPLDYQLARATELVRGLDLMRSTSMAR